MEPQLHKDKDKKRVVKAANVFWLRKRSKRLVEISTNMSELCMNPDSIEAASELFKHPLLGPRFQKHFFSRLKLFCIFYFCLPLSLPILSKHL